MGALFFAELKRLGWVWLLLTVAITISFASGTRSFHPSTEQSKAEVQFHQERGDLDPAKAREIKQMWSYPYYLARVILPNIVLFLTILSIFIGAGLIARESERGTLRLLLSFPVNRYRVLLNKYAIGALLLGVTVGLVTAFIYFSSIYNGEVLTLRNVTIAGLLMALQFLVIYGYTFMLSVFFNSQLAVLGASCMVSFALFLIPHPLLAKTGYLDIGSVLSLGAVPWPMASLMLLAVVFLFVLSVVMFERKELTS